MKTAERENPNRRPQCVANRADGAASQYRSCSIMWAAKQENFQPAEKCFFLTSPFIEQCVANRADGAASQYRSCSIMWAAKQENFQPAEKCFFLTSPFIEQTGHLTYQDFTCPVSAFTRHWPNLTLIPVPTAILAHRRLCWVFQYLSR